MQVEVRALATLYEPRGRFQLTVEAMRRAGLGPLYERFLRLKEKLGAEGLFEELKRELPAHPRRIGVVTSLAAAALRDVLTTLARRNPAIEVIVYPVPVQGEGAAERIAAMLARASRRAECEVLLLVRGGGSIEDLWQFNEEAVARAIRASGIPVVVGVGHETDTIADFAADRRAPTPTAAAELVSPPRAELAARVAGNVRALHREMERKLRYAAGLSTAVRTPPRASGRAAALVSRAGDPAQPGLLSPFSQGAPLPSAPRGAARNPDVRGPDGGARARLQHHVQHIGQGSAQRRRRAPWASALRRPWPRPN